MKATRLILFGIVSFIMVSCLDSEDPNKALNEEVKQIDEYLQTMGLADEALYDNVNGYRLVINHYGQYPPPHSGQIVKVHYEGKLFDNGTLFDFGTEESKLEDLTPQILQYVASNLMSKSDATIFVPSSRGYGEEGSAALGVPPNSILVYDVYLEEVKRTALEQSRFVTDSTLIADYLDTNQISATYHPGGIWYSITQQGTGDYPNVYNSITCDYKLRLLSDPGTNLQESTIQQSNIFFELIDGFKVALPLFNEGTKATFYVPSGLGYGASGSGSIPANANLIFDVTLTTVH